MAVASVRALLGGTLTFGTVALTTYQTTGNWSDAIVAGGVAGLTYLMTRGGFEGAFDQMRDSARPPAAAPGDVGAAPTVATRRVVVGRPLSRAEDPDRDGVIE